MHKLAALALTAAVGIAGMSFAKPADARVVVGVGIGLPGVAVAASPALGYAPGVGMYAPHYFGHAHYFRPGFVHYGYGFHGYGYAHGRRWR